MMEIKYAFLQKIDGQFEQQRAIENFTNMSNETRSLYDSCLECQLSLEFLERRLSTTQYTFLGVWRAGAFS